jgi:hypothetical protein
MINYSENYSLESLFYINEDGLVCQEKWKPIVGYESKYEVSDLGRVKTFNYRRNPFIMVQEQLKKGYCRISLFKDNKKKRVLVHVLVCQEFKGYIQNNKFKVIDHIDNNPKNNIASNLQIISFRENIIKDMPKPKTGENNIRIMKGKFQVRFVVDKKTNYLGCYETLKEAVFVRNKFIEKLNQDFKKHLN